MGSIVYKAELVQLEHRRRIKTEEKAKVVGSLDALAVLPRTILKSRMSSSLSFK